MAESRFPTSSRWCTTQSEIEPITFKWTIKNFSYHVREVGYSIKSSTFSSATKNGCNWFLKACPNGTDEKSKHYLSLFLYSVPVTTVPSFNLQHVLKRLRTARVERQGKQLTASVGRHNKTASIQSQEIHIVSYRCSIMDRNCEKSRYDFNTSVLKFIGSSGRVWNKFVKISDLRANAHELLPHDTLTILCEINVLKNVHNASGEFSFSDGPKCTLSDDMSYLFENKLFSDVTLAANGKEFLVHKSILAARSTVFAAMFSTDMKEKNQNFINIVDMDVDVLCHMLHFIYSGKIPTDAGVKVYSNLLTAADKYNLEILKVKCEHCLFTQFTLDNVTDLLKLAYLHNATELKETAMDFIAKQALTVMATDKWEHLVQSYPRLANDVFKHQLQKLNRIK